MFPVKPDPVAPGQESVWRYPRPPRAEPTSRRIRIALGGIDLPGTSSSIRTLETSHPPTYYIPRADIAISLLTATDRTSASDSASA